MSSQRYYNSNEGNSHDLKMSFFDYKHMIDVLRDDRLSEEAIMKFKNLYSYNAQFYTAFGLLLAPISYGVS